MSKPTERADLVARQGHGARYDAAEAPHDLLRSARHGTSYFSRILNSLEDEALALPSQLKQYSRAEIVAFVSYSARAAAYGLEGISNHEGIPASFEDLASAADLPTRALRALYRHSSIHLDVTWRDLPGTAWKANSGPVTQSGTSAVYTVQQRVEVIWSASLALGHGTKLSNVPENATATVGLEVLSHHLTIACG